MLHRFVGRLLGAAALVALSVAAAGPVAAGVVADGTATVIVHAASADGVNPGRPLAGATVTLEAWGSDFDDSPIQRLSAVANAEGIATFEGVTRADPASAPVHLVATAAFDRISTDARGCVLTESWDGMTQDVVSEVGVTIEIEAQLTSSLECAVLEGSVRTAAGGPVDVARAFVAIVPPPDEPALGFPFEVAADGSFAVTLPPVGTREVLVALRVEVTSRPTRAERGADGCVRTYAEEGSWTADVALGDGEPLPFAAIVTQEVVARTDCSGAPGAGAPVGSARPAITLPPTDAGLAARRAAPASSWGLAVGLVLLAVVVAATAPRRP